MCSMAEQESVCVLLVDAALLKNPSVHDAHSG